MGDVEDNNRQGPSEHTTVREGGYVPVRPLDMSGLGHPQPDVGADDLNSSIPASKNHESQQTAQQDNKGQEPAAKAP